MTKKNCRRIISAFLAAVTAAGILSLPGFAADKTAAEEEQERVNQSILNIISAIPYDKYDELHEDAPAATKTVTVNAADAVIADKTTSEVSEETHQGRRALRTSDTGKVTLGIDVPETGRYVLKIDYCTVSDKINAVERLLYINDKIPFSEARLLQMKKIWKYEFVEQEDGTMRFKVDGSGNELRPSLKPDHVWQQYVCTDRDGLHSEPFEIYLEAGKNELTLQAEREEAYFGDITLCPAEETPTYEEVKAEYERKGYAAGSDVIKIQAEEPSAVSDATLFPNNNRTSAITEPQHATKYLLNAIGDGTSGYANGQWTEYTFDIETPGLYTVVLKYKQSFSSGVFVSRKILVDGELPYKEAGNLRFYSGNSWNVTEAKDTNEETLEFYFDKGEHTVRIETTLGDMADIIRRVSNVQSSANADYLQILRLTGANPDEYRDYGFKRVMPETIKDLYAQSKVLNQCIDELREFSKSRSEMTALLEQAANVMEKMGSNEDEVAKNLSDLKTQLGTVGSWVISAKDQPLQLDYIVIQPAGGELPQKEANFFQAMGYEFGQFFGSFFTDYGAMGVEDLSADTTSTLDAWTAKGRDQAQIIRTQINNKFAPATGTAVNLKLVAGDALLPAILAGIGPDIALEGMAGQTASGASGDIMDYALRGALIPLYNEETKEGFSDFKEIQKRFSPSAFINLNLYGTYYGLPVGQEWDMLFYRSDVLAALDLTVPETWDDLLAMIPVLQFNNMDMGIAPSDSLLATLTFQRGSTIWADNGMRINFDSNACLEAFDMMASLYTRYGLPIAYDGANRFRTGEMPVLIGGYAGTYNSIVIYATELAGLWDFAPIPGTRQADGTIDRTANTSGDPVTMPKDCRDTEKAWEFMKWYTDKDFQSSYANELIALMGEAAKYATANLEALEEMSWTQHEYEQLMEQSKSLSGYQSYPGKYFIKRYVSFSINNVYNELADPIETLLGYVPTINKEITRKRTEFGLETVSVGQTLGTKRLDEAKEILDGIPDSEKDKYGPLYNAFETAYEKRDAEMIRSAAKSYADADADLFGDAVTKLNEAADAFDNYD
ncbi:MAG: extracellular solute-binding protein [Clostridia bacterium]|nr:extracellular solute-binding protein [Clostridia bacterium]